MGIPVTRCRLATELTHLAWQRRRLYVVGMDAQGHESFEACLVRLKNLAAKLDNPDLPLETFAAKYEQAQTISKNCRAELDRLKQLMAASLNH